MLGLRTDTQSHWNLYVIIDSRVVLACGLFSISRLFHILLDAGLSEYGLYFLHLFYIARTSARHDLNQLSQVAKVHITAFAPERIQRWGIACSRSTHNSAPGSGVFQIGYQVTASKKMDENGILGRSSIKYLAERGNNIWEMLSCLFAECTGCCQAKNHK